MTVVEALALVGQLNATLIEDGLEHLGTVALDSRIKSAVARITHALTNPDESIPRLAEVVGTAGSLGKVQQHLGIAHGNQRLSVTLETG